MEYPIIRYTPENTVATFFPLVTAVSKRRCSDITHFKEELEHMTDR